MRPTQKNLWQTVVSHLDDTSEKDWVDTVCRNLKKGRMCLLIVGDGIREDVEGLAAVVDGHPDFEFRLGLIELRVHAFEGSSRRLIVPSVMSRTTEVVRAIIQLETGTNLQIVAPPLPKSGHFPKDGALTRVEFLDNVTESLGREREAVARRLLEMIEEPLVVVCGKNSFSVKIRDPAGSNRLLSLLTVPANADCWYYETFLRDQLQALWNDGTAVERVLKRMNELLAHYRARATTSKTFIVDLINFAEHEKEFLKDRSGVADLVRQESVRSVDSQNRPT